MSNKQNINITVDAVGILQFVFMYFIDATKHM